MAGKREKPEEVVSKLRQVEVLQGQVATIANSVRQIGVMQQTGYRWRKLYGEMPRPQLTRLKEPEKENQHLRRAVSDLTLKIIDEYMREALMTRVDRKLNSTDVMDALTDLFTLRGPPDYLISYNGPEFIAQKVRDWIAAVGAKTPYIEPGSPWEKGYSENFNARFRGELLNGEIC